MLVGKKQSIRLAPFSQKYIEYFNRSKEAKINVLEGSIRSGKTILNICAFVNYLDNHESGGNFIASGVSAGVAWEILAECRGHSSEDGKYGAEHGFGLLYMFGGRCKKTKIKHSDALVIKNRKGKECRIIFVGAKNRGCIELIRGLTIAGWLATELENHSTDDGNDFIGFMFGRLLGAPDGKMFFDLNPSFPTNKMYTEYLDPYGDPNSEMYLGEDYNYLKCGLFDNAAFTKKQIEDTLRLYKDKTSVMYQRDILGNRACAQGIIFQSFAKTPGEWIVNDLSSFLADKTPQFISIGVDFGGNGSDTSFVATLFYNNYHGVVIIADDKIDMSSGSVNSFEFRDRLLNFLMSVIAIGVAQIRYIYCDSADTVMKNDVKWVWKQLKMANSCRIIGSKKDKIRNRINCKNILISSKHWHVMKNCVNVINSTSTQVWDSRDGHEDERLDNGSVDIDTADAEEYSWSAFMDKLIQFA